MTGPSILTDDWPPYLVLAISRDDSAGGGHDHVMAVDTRDPDGGETRWGIQELIAAIRDGERFAVESEGASGGHLQPSSCPACSRTTLVAVAGAAAGS